MNQKQIDKIHDLVNETGIGNTLSIFGGDNNIIRKAYIDNPEAYINYLIGNLHPIKDCIGLTRWTYMYSETILSYDDVSNDIYIDDFTWNFFYKGILQFDDDKISKLFTKWLYKHYPKLSERKPKPYTDRWDIDMRLKQVGLKLNRNV